MKKFLMSLLISVLIFSLFSCGKNAENEISRQPDISEETKETETEETTEEETSEKEPVYISKVLRERFYDGFSVCCKVYEYLYDGDGRICAKVECDGFGDPVFTYNVAYNRENLVCREICTDVCDRVVSITETEYDEKNRKTLITEKNAENEILHTVMHSYAEDGKDTALYKDSEGRTTKKARLDANGFIITEEEYGQDGEVTLKTEYGYENGRKSEAKIYLDSKLKEEQKYIYENGKLMSVTFSDGYGEVIKNRFYKYDLHGNIVCIKEENKASVPIFRKESEYITEIQK